MSIIQIESTTMYKWIVDLCAIDDMNIDPRIEHAIDTLCDEIIAAMGGLPQVQAERKQMTYPVLSAEEYEAELKRKEAREGEEE